MLSDAEMFQWIIDNKASIQHSRPMTWVRTDGTRFSTDFTLCYKDIQVSGYPTLREAIQATQEFKYV